MDINNKVSEPSDVLEKPVIDWGSHFIYDGNNLVWKDTGNSVTNAKLVGKMAGTKTHCNKSTYILVGLKDRHYYAHRIIWEMMYGAIPDGLQIDHIDGCGTNNTIDNLRLVTQSTNLKNTRLSSKSVTGVVGVGWDSKSCKYKVYISNGGKKEHLGYFQDFFEAVCRRKSAEIKSGYHLNHGRR